MLLRQVDIGQGAGVAGGFSSVQAVTPDDAQVTLYCKTPMVDFSSNSPLQWLVLALVTAMACLASGHALLHKDDSRAAFGWIAVCLLFPAVGPALYLLFGVNRIRTRARRLEAEHRFHFALDAERAVMLASFVTEPDALSPEVSPLARVVGVLSERPLLFGNRVEPLYDGEEAYPAMLTAIRS